MRTQWLSWGWTITRQNLNNEIVVYSQEVEEKNFVDSFCCCLNPFIGTSARQSIGC